jgi:phosphate:Na+ symporter
VPEKREETDSLATPRYLGKSSVATPALALSHALLETVRMSELLDRMFETALLSLRTGKLETLKLLKGQAEQLAIYRTTLHGHLSDIASLELSKPEIRRALELMLYVSNLQHAGDVIHRNFAERIKAKSKEGVKLSDEEQASLDDLCLIIHDNLRLATGVLTSGDVAAARSLIAQKDAFRSLENDVLDEHFRNPSMGRGAALRRSVLYVDMIRDLHRINSHIVSAGYPIVDAAGLLRDSRLRETGS